MMPRFFHDSGGGSRFGLGAIRRGSVNLRPLTSRRGGRLRIREAASPRLRLVSTSQPRVRVRARIAASAVEGWNSSGTFAESQSQCHQMVWSGAGGTPDHFPDSRHAGPFTKVSPCHGSAASGPTPRRQRRTADTKVEIFASSM
jgi:hypothetical protein